MSPFQRPPSWRTGFVLSLLTTAALAGCGKNDGPSDYEKMVEQKQKASGSLAGSGAKFEEKQFAVGKGWVVDLRGVTVSEELLKQVKALGNIAELNLSKTNVSDDHLRIMHDLDLHVVLAKLDLSHSAVTDAGLVHLNGCIFLMELNLTGTKVSPAAVSEFKKARMADPKAKIKNTSVKI